MARAFAAGAVAELEALSASSTVFAGAFYSTLLAATFGPTELVIRSAARTRVPQGEAPDKWLADHGFNASVLASIWKAAAVFAPLLAGVLKGIAEVKF